MEDVTINNSRDGAATQLTITLFPAELARDIAELAMDVMH